MKSELHSLADIFSGKILRIPDYQRGYSWKERQIADFWSDLIRLRPEKNHYTGVLTLEPTSPATHLTWEDDIWIIEAKKYKPYYIVDGQQRLTTSIILIQSILETLAADQELNFTSAKDIRKQYIFETKDGGISRSYLFGYEKDNPSYEFLKRRIFLEDSEIHLPGEETIYTTNLANAKKFFKTQLQTHSQKDVEKIYSKLIHNLLFNIFYIEPGLDVFVTFETMNNRGKPLSQLELLKNRLIYLCNELECEASEKSRLRRNINESWKSIYHYLGKQDSKLLNDDLFLRTHFLSYHGPDFETVDPDDPDNSDFDIYRYVRNDVHKSYLLEKIFTIQRINADDADRLDVAEIDHYAQDIKKCVENYFYLFDPDSSPYPDGEKIWLDRLSRFESPDLNLITLVAIQTTKETERRINFMKELERFAFIRRLRPYLLNKVSLEQLAIKLKANKHTLEEIVRKLNSEVDSFIKSSEFAEAIKTIGKGDGYYGWRGLRYFMYEYEQSLRYASKTARNILNWNDFKSEDFETDHRTIEHIYPQRATDQYWKDRFNILSIPERNILKNSLGNLLPVSSPKNSSLSNKDFLTKCGSTSSQVGYRYGCLSEIQVSSLPEWKPSHILGRGLHLLNFMEKRWNINIGDRESKTELLGLKFLNNRHAISSELALNEFRKKAGDLRSDSN